MVPAITGKVAIIAIGRNEGERLKLCLRAAARSANQVIYVDSGSTDGSVEFARSLDCQVVELDSSPPFTAARARNAGFACAKEIAPGAPLVQFLDGDCEMEDGWLQQAVAAFSERDDVGVVCGPVREAHPEASVYNRLCDLEWRQAPGEILSAGGRFMVRARAFEEAGGFRAALIAGEDEEFCVRVRQAGWKILLIDAPMAKHDAAITHFGQWWRRNRRAGHAYAEVNALHGKGRGRHFVRECRRILVWGLALPVAALALAPFTRVISLLVLLCIYALQFIHIARGCRKRGWANWDAFTYGFFTVLGRFATLQGLLQYHLRRLRRRSTPLIEYK